MANKRRRGLTMANLSNICLLCQKEEEMVNYLFLRCEVADDTWSHLIARCGIGGITWDLLQRHLSLGSQVILVVVGAHFSK